MLCCRKIQKINGNYCVFKRHIENSLLKKIMLEKRKFKLKN